MAVKIAPPPVSEQLAADVEDELAADAAEENEAALWAWRLEAFRIAAMAAAGQAPPRGNTTEYLCDDAHRIFSEITFRQWNGQPLTSPPSAR
jgi:hypothetical protein